jgi:hypothetical protein
MVNDLCLNVSARTNVFHRTFILEGKKTICAFIHQSEYIQWYNVLISQHQLDQLDCLGQTPTVTICLELLATAARN